MQAPQWTEFLQCPICLQAFSETVRLPISLACGHTACKSCLNSLQRKQCQFCSSPIHTDIDKLPVNDAILQLGGAPLERPTTQALDAMGADERAFHVAKRAIEALALLLKPLSASGNVGAANHGFLSRPMQRKLVTLVNCQLVEAEGRARALRAARSLGERTVTELLLQHQNQQQLSANLWAAVRQRGCQFLGPALQEECLRLILLALKDGEQLARKTLVMFVVQKLQEKQYQQASKTSVGHVVQLLYRASCFKVTKRDDDSSLMELKEEFRTIESLRREHDVQVVQIAMEAGLRIAPDQWSSLLYGDAVHKSHMQSIIDKLQTNDSFSHSIDELVIALTRSGDPHHLGDLRPQFELLSQISPSVDSPVTEWETTHKAMEAVEAVVNGLVKFTQANQKSKAPDFGQPFNNKYKTSMCKDMQQRGACPRGVNCTFAHSEDEMERYRFMRRGRPSQTKLPAPPIASVPTSIPSFPAGAGPVPVPVQSTQFSPFHPGSQPQHPQSHIPGPYYGPQAPPMPNFYERPLIRPMSQSGYPPIHQGSTPYNSMPTQSKPPFQMLSMQPQDARYNSMPVAGSGYKESYSGGSFPRQQQHQTADFVGGTYEGFSSQQSGVPPYQREEGGGGGGLVLIGRGSGNPYDPTAEYDPGEKSSGFPARFNEYLDAPGFPQSTMENDFSGDYQSGGSHTDSTHSTDLRSRKTGYTASFHGDGLPMYRQDMYNNSSSMGPRFGRPGRWSSAGDYQSQLQYGSKGGGVPQAGDYDASGYDGTTFGGQSTRRGGVGMYNRRWSQGVHESRRGNSRLTTTAAAGAVPGATFNTYAQMGKDNGQHKDFLDEKECSSEMEMFSSGAGKLYNGNVTSPAKAFSAAVGTPPSSKSPESKEMRKIASVDSAGSLFGNNVSDANLASVWQEKGSPGGTSSTGPSPTVASSSGLRSSPWSTSSSHHHQGDGWPMSLPQPEAATDVDKRLAELKQFEEALLKKEAMLEERESEQRKISQATERNNDVVVSHQMHKEWNERDKLALNGRSAGNTEEEAVWGFQQMNIDEVGSGSGAQPSPPPAAPSPPTITASRNASGNSDFDHPVWDHGSPAATSDFELAIQLAVSEDDVKSHPRGSPLESLAQ
eukprot:m.306225 g.306225  ORF g.306225 m.306225 type:complete len:1117 (+) comp41072_c0_seq1:1181-4531(+)